MFVSQTVLGYVLAVAVGVLAPTGVRLNNTGEAQGAGRSNPGLMLVITLLYGITVAAAVFYFSWAYLDWKQILTFFVVYFIIGNSIARSSSRAVVWAGFTSAVLIAALAEVLLVAG